MSVLYKFILFNLDSLPKEVVEELLIELELEYNALYLKRKFNDKRPLESIKKIIKQELSKTA